MIELDLLFRGQPLPGRSTSPPGCSRRATDQVPAPSRLVDVAATYLKTAVRKAGQRLRRAAASPRPACVQE